MTPFLNVEEVRRMQQLTRGGRSWSKAYRIVVKERKK